MLEEIVANLIKERERKEKELVWVLESPCLSPSEKEGMILNLLSEIYDVVMKISIATNYIKVEVKPEIEKNNENR